MRDFLHRIASDTLQLARVLVCWYHGHDWTGWRDKPRWHYGGKGRMLDVQPLLPNYQDRTCWRCNKYEERRKSPPMHFNCRSSDRLMLGSEQQPND